MARGSVRVHPRCRRRGGSGGDFLHADDQSLAQHGKRLLQGAELRRMHGIEHAPDFLLVLLKPPAELDLRHAGLREGTEERELRRDFGLNRDGRELTALRPVFRQGATFAGVDQECEAERVSRHIQRLRPRRALRDRLRHIREAYDEARLVPGLDQRSVSERLYHGSSLQAERLADLARCLRIDVAARDGCPSRAYPYESVSALPSCLLDFESQATRFRAISEFREKAIPLVQPALLPRGSDIFVRSSSIPLGPEAEAVRQGA